MLRLAFLKGRTIDFNSSVLNRELQKESLKALMRQHWYSVITNVICILWTIAVSSWTRKWIRNPQHFPASSARRCLLGHFSSLLLWLLTCCHRASLQRCPQFSRPSSRSPGCDEKFVPLTLMQYIFWYFKHWRSKLLIVESLCLKLCLKNISFDCPGVSHSRCRLVHKVFYLHYLSESHDHLHHCDHTHFTMENSGA